MCLVHFWHQMTSYMLDISKTSFINCPAGKGKGILANTVCYYKNTQILLMSTLFVSMSAHMSIFYTSVYVFVYVLVCVCMIAESMTKCPIPHLSLAMFWIKHSICSLLYPHPPYTIYRHTHAHTSTAMSHYTSQDTH